MLEPSTLQIYHEDEHLDEDKDQPFDPEALAPEEYGIKVDAYDELLPAEPLLEKDGMIVRAQIAGCKRDSHGNLIGQYNPNPLLNTCVYIATFPNGHIAECTQIKSQNLSTKLSMTTALMNDYLTLLLDTRKILIDHLLHQNTQPKVGVFVYPEKMVLHHGITYLM